MPLYWLDHVRLWEMVLMRCCQIYRLGLIRMRYQEIKFTLLTSIQPLFVFILMLVVILYL